MPKEKCRICGNVQTCTQCDICSLKSCQECLKIHKDSCSKLKENKKHFCHVHDDYVNGYCFTCFHLVCANCAVDVKEHVSHTIHSIPDALYIIQSELLTSIEDLAKREAQEEHAMTKLCAKKKNFDQSLPSFVDAEEKRLHKVITNAKDSLLQKILTLSKKNETNLSSSKTMITQLVAAKENLKCVQEEHFPIAFLSQWSNPRVVIEKHQDILENRDSSDNIVLESESDVTRMFRYSISKETSDNIDMENFRTVDCHLQEIQQLPKLHETGNINPDIQFMMDTTKILTKLLAKIDEGKTERKVISLACKCTPVINEYVKTVELVHNSIVKLKNDLLQSQNDLNKIIEKMVDWTHSETTSREKDTKMYLKDVNERNRKLLSSVADEKLAKDDPPIMDLGDPNRPMRIGVKFSELYDSEWTDAMENISRVKKYYPDMMESEIQEIIMRHLHRLLKCCYRECHMKADEQIRRLKETLAETMCLTFKSTEEFTSLPVCREASVLRRTKSEGFANFLFQNQMLCKNIITDWDYINKNEQMVKILKNSTFFEKCVYLCWLMVIQDPIMYLDDDPVSYAQIDKNAYEEFGKSGDSVAFVIWPALFLHKGGPLLLKGVVQAYWKKDGNLDGTRV